MKRYIKHLILSFLFWKVVRWFERVQWFPAQSRTVKTTKRLPIIHEGGPMPGRVAGISARDYFHARRNRPQNKRAEYPSDTTDAAFMAWRVKNNR
jgi:hypothetical protein